MPWQVALFFAAFYEGGVRTCCSTAGFHHLLLLLAACSWQHHLGKKTCSWAHPCGVVCAGNINLLCVPAGLRAGLGGCVGEKKLQLPKDKPNFIFFLKDSVFLKQIHGDMGGNIRLCIEREKCLAGKHDRPAVLNGRCGWSHCGFVVIFQKTGKI